MKCPRCQRTSLRTSAGDRWKVRQTRIAKSAINKGKDWRARLKKRRGCPQTRPQTRPHRLRTVRYLTLLFLLPYFLKRLPRKARKRALQYAREAPGWNRERRCQPNTARS